jgi:aminopeptidase N
VFDGIIRTMSRWAVNTSDQGPVYLGYRLGHVRGDSKILRAVVYNKGAMVLHMLRRLVGDEPFFRGLRRFYDENRFQKAGTDGLRLAFEAETGRSLSRFFDRWIYGQDLPALTWTTRTEGTGEDQAVVIRFDQGSRVFDVPVTVSVQLSDGSFKDVVVPVTEQVVEQRIPVTGKIRAVRVNRDRAALLAERD